VDLRMLLRAVRRHKVVFGVVVVLGVLAGAGFAVLRPPLLSSKVLVDVPASKQIQTQAVIAGSDPVLLAASHSDPALSFEQLLRQVKVVESSSNLLAITVSAKTAAEAQDGANAVARSYVAFVRSPGAPGVQVLARVVCGPGSAGLCASPATQTGLSAWVAVTTGFGALAGVVLGVIAAFALVRPRRTN
jgi:capsular polysaccharide biosynthesis protein